MPRVLAAAMGPGVGGDEDVGDVQAGGQGHGHGDTGRAGAADQSLADGVEDDEAGVAEHGDGDHPAHELHSQLGILLAHQLDNHVSQLQGGAGLLQDGADQSAQDDDDTDGAEGAGETGADDGSDTGFGNAVNRGIDQGDSGDHSQQQGNCHDCQEGVHLELGDRHDHDDDSKHKCDDEG